MPQVSEARGRWGGGWALVALPLVATAVRAWDLGGNSFWYDEVVTMRLAKSPTISAMVARLFQTDATRAPLHPLLLQGWLTVFGDSEAAGRSLSVVFGVATVGLLVALGWLTFDRSTGLWTGWLGAFSPMLVYYAREVRMYALLVLLTTLCWTLLFWSRRAGAAWWRTAAYAACLAAAILTHPLALIMWVALGAASALDARGFFGSWKGWLAANLAPTLLTAGWLRYYLDHPPEHLNQPPSIRFLLGTPIGFLGGNFLALGALVGLIGFGLARRRRAGDAGEWVAPACLGVWLALPPTMLYLYSRIGSPVFGPARYTLYVAPAYLALVAQGLARLPRVGGWAAGLGVLGMSGAMLGSLVHAPDSKTDWRGFARALAKSGEPAAVLVVSDSPLNFEVETARYYLAPAHLVLPFDEAGLDAPRRETDQAVLLAMGARSYGKLAPEVRERIDAEFTRSETYDSEDPLVFRCRRRGARETYSPSGRGTCSPAAPGPEEPANRAPD